ncbi:hypothetical protein cypCar_00003777 [Cyprinus carpio]|nr:hypothetical protein cypCar_00003777 [Cyprinus carpio]
MANTVASLVVQTELLPSQASSSLSPFPSLLPSIEDGEEDGEKGEEEGKESGTVGLTGDIVTSSTPPVATVAQNPEHPFQCLDCGKSFKWSSRLAHHQRSHNNERPYRCNLCPKAFKGSSALLYHQSVHTGLRTFQCSYCPLTFKWSSHYQYHLRQHTGECPYPCDSCSKAFKNSSSLRRHKNVHLGFKPYICDVCNKAFSQSTNLRQHMRIHTGERPYICGDCGRSFTHSSNLALHRISHIEGKGKSAGKPGGAGPGSATREMEVVLTEDLNTVGMSISEMVGLVGGQEGGVGQVFLSHDTSLPATSGSVNQNILPQLTLTPTSSTVTDTERTHMSKTNTGANVLLFSCGSCNETFSTQSHLEEHQTLHLDSLGPAGGEGVATENSTGAEGGGVSLVGATPLLADFEEVVETTTVTDSGQTAELLGLDAIRNESGQAQYDLLQTFTASVNQMPTDTSVSTAQATTECAYCGKSFKTSSGLTRHVAQAHPLALSESRSQFNCSACDRSFPLLSSLLNHQHSHTPEQRLLAEAEAEAEIVCPSLSLPLPSLKKGGGGGEREIHVSLIAVTEEGERRAVKPSAKASGKGARRGGGSKTSATNNEFPQLNIDNPPAVSPVSSSQVPESSSIPAVSIMSVTANSTLTNSSPMLSSDPERVSVEEKVVEEISREHFVLCLKKEMEKGGQGDGVEVKVEMEGGNDAGQSYVFQIEGEGQQEEGGNSEGGEKSYVLRFQTEGECEGDAGKEKAEMVSLNLLQEWTGQSEGRGNAEGSVEVEKSFVLHFQTEPQSEEDIQPSSGFIGGPGEDLSLSCHPGQALVPLEGQDVVFELGDEAKMDGSTGPGDSVQMIALIEGEGNGSGARGSFKSAVGANSGQMEGIFQLEGGEGIVIIEVSTSSLREGGMEATNVGHTLAEGTEDKQANGAREEVMSEELKLAESESISSSEMGLIGT